MTRINV